MILLDGIIYSLQKFGGISIYYDSLIKKINEKNISCSLILYQDKKSFDSLLNINVIRSKLRYFERFRNVKSIVPSSVFHSSYYRNPVDNRIPVILTIHDFTYEKMMTGYKKEIHIAQKRMAIKKAETIICISNTTKKDLLELYDVKNKNIIVIPNGVSDTFKPMNINNEKKYIVYVGSRARYKNFQAALQIIEKITNIELWVVGSEILETELKYVSEKCKKRIISKGYVTEIVLNEIYNNAICLIYPSLYEGFGIPILEAFRARCPVVIGDCKALLEFGERNLHVCKTNKTEEYVETIKFIMKKNRSEITNNGYIESLKYSWDKTAEEHLKIYQKYL